MRLILSCVTLILGFLSCVSAWAEGGQVWVTVARNYAPLPDNEKVSLVFDWNEIVRRSPGLIDKGISVVDLNFGTTGRARQVDTNGDRKADILVYDFQFLSNEPIYTFSLRADGNLVLTDGQATPDRRLKISYLTSSADYATRTGRIKNWSDKIMESTMQIYPDPSGLSINAPGKWNYEYGFFLNAGLERWRKTKRDDFYRYIKSWADLFLDEKGAMDVKQYDVSEFKLDDILPGRLFISLFEITHDEKYKVAADRFRDHLLRQPKTSDGGYWHKQIYPYQMWLDGIFMGDVFSVQYASAFKEPAFYDEAIRQIKLIAHHTTDSKTGLMYHGWDESKNKIWADQTTGTSPEFWGRAMGWYMMALVQCLDYIPRNHPERKDVIVLLQKLATNVLRYQDKKSGLWYQIVDKGDQPGNWIETSCSAMFAYAMAKGSRQGFLDASFQQAAKRAYNALIADYVFFDDQGRLYFDQTVKVGTLNFKTSKGDFDYYIGGERRINDYKGLGALLYASLEIE